MSKDTESVAAEDAVEKLLKLAGHRDMPTEVAMTRARIAAYAVWQQSMQHRKAPRWKRYLALAACTAAIAIIGSIFMLQKRPVDTLPVVAHVAVVDGDVGLQANTDTVKAAINASPVFANTQIVTGTGRIALTLQSNLSLRLNQHTTVVFIDAEHARLLSGEIYVDAGLARLSTPLLIETPVGEVMHRGTQYRVSVIGDATLIQVREGSVQIALASNREALSVGVGEQLRVEERGRVEWRAGLGGFGSEWDWVTKLASQFDIENRSLGEYLSWFAREQGLAVRYQSAQVERIALSAHLHGAVNAEVANVNLDELSLITGMSIRRQQGVIYIAQN
jgi:ferric-dicitrate binding protein FerR (iron transport regulator)